MDPALDESFLRLGAAKRVFPDRERAHVAQQRFDDYEGDGGEVQAAEPRIEREALPERDPDPGGDQATGNEDNEGCVDEEDGVGEHSGAAFCFGYG